MVAVVIVVVVVVVVVVAVVVVVVVAGDPVHIQDTVILSKQHPIETGALSYSVFQELLKTPSANTTPFKHQLIRNPFRRFGGCDLQSVIRKKIRIRNPNNP